MKTFIITALIIVGIILLVAAITVGIILLVQRKRAKSATWMRITGSIVGEQKSKLPGCWRAYILYRIPETGKNSTVYTCLLSKRPVLHKKAQMFDLMTWKDRKGKTRKTAYPVTAKTLDKVQTQRVNQRPPKFTR